MLQEPGSYVGEVVKLMGKTKVLVKTGQEGKYIVDFANDIKLEDLRPNLRVALRSDCESGVASSARSTSPVSNRVNLAVQPTNYTAYYLQRRTL